MDELLPIIGLILGVIVLAYAVLAYTGSTVLQSAPAFLSGRKGDLLWVGGWLLVGLALIMGSIGSLIAANLLIPRIIVGILGLLLLVLAWPRSKTTA
jgi:hypothetical protein